MTPPASSPRIQGDNNPSPTKSKSRNLHSSRQANSHRKYRARFDQFRNSMSDSTATGDRLELMEWQSELEASTLDSTILRIVEENMLRDREMKYNMSGSDTRRRKIKDLQRIVQEFDVDGVDSGCGHSLKSWSSPYFSQEINCTTAHNIHSPRVSLGQPGGTGILITPTLFEYAPNHGCRSQGSRPMDVMETLTYTQPCDEIIVSVLPLLQLIR